MRDIGKINERVENLEYYSQLNMLEKDTESFKYKMQMDWIDLRMDLL